MNPSVEVPKLVNFIQERVFEATRKGCVVGVSGGVDSAVIAALCKLAYPSTTLGVNMPYKTADKGSSRRAEELCEKLDIPMILDIVEPVNSYEHFPANSMAEGNMQARMRMAKLYYHGERTQALVIGTDNRSENYTGFFTKYGDGGVDCNPLAQYYKSEVYALAKYLGVPESIINASPTPEFTDLTDEAEFGFTYDELENAIRKIESGNTPEACADTREGEVIRKVIRMNKVTEHKRNMPYEYQRA